MDSEYIGLPAGIQPRGLTREAAAAYIGLLPDEFDRAVASGEMPKANMYGVWDRLAVDAAFDALPSDDYWSDPSAIEGKR